MNSPTLPPDIAPVLRIREVAKFIRVSDKTVRRLIDAGKLDSVKIRGLRFVRMESLAMLMQKGTA